MNQHDVSESAATLSPRIHLVAVPKWPFGPPSTATFTSNLYS